MSENEQWTDVLGFIRMGMKVNGTALVVSVAAISKPFSVGLGDTSWLMTYPSWCFLFGLILSFVSYAIIFSRSSRIVKYKTIFELQKYRFLESKDNFQKVNIVRELNKSEKAVLEKLKEIENLNKIGWRYWIMAFPAYGSYIAFIIGVAVGLSLMAVAYMQQAA